MMGVSNYSKCIYNYHAMVPASLLQVKLSDPISSTMTKIMNIDLYDYEVDGTKYLDISCNLHIYYLRDALFYL